MLTPDLLVENEVSPDQSSTLQGVLLQSVHEQQQANSLVIGQQLPFAFSGTDMQDAICGQCPEAVSLQELFESEDMVLESHPATYISLQVNGCPSQHIEVPFSGIVQSQPSCAFPAELAAGAMSVQSAPTDLVLHVESAVPVLHSQEQASSSTAFQQVSEGPFGTMDPAGSQPGERVWFSPSQEHSLSEEMVPFLYNLKNLQDESNNSNADNFPILTDIQKVFPQKSQIIHEFSDHTILESNTQKDKLLCPNVGVIQAQHSENKENDMVSVAINKETLTNNVFLPASATSDNNPAYEQKLSDYTKVNEKKTKPKSYSKAVAPPNVYQETSSASPDCGVVMDRIMGYSQDAYAWAIEEVVGESSITFIGRHPGNDDSMLVFLTSSDLVEKLVTDGIWLRRTWLNVSYFQRPAIKLVVSGVMPFVPDGAIIEAFAPFGTSVYRVLRRVPAAVRDRHFKGLLSYRREIYIIKSTPETIIPEKLNIDFLGVPYVLEISRNGPRCFACGSLSHTIIRCDQKEKVDNNKTESGTAVSSAPVLFVQMEESSSLNKKEENSNSESTITNTNIINSSDGQKLHTSTSNIVVAKKDHFAQCNLTGLPRLKLLFRQGVGQSSKSGQKRNQSISNNEQPSAVNKTKLTKPKLVGGVSSGGGVDIVVGSQLQDSNNPSRQLSDPVTPLVKTGQLDQLTAQSGTKKPRKSINIPIQDVPVLLQASNFGNHQDLDVTEVEEMTIDSVQTEDPGTMSSFHLVVPSSTTINNNNNKNNKKNNAKPPIIQSLLNESKKKVDGSLILDQNFSVGGSIESMSSADKAVALIEDWLTKSATLKNAPKKKLASQMILLHPNLEEIITLALSVSDRFPVSSAHGKRIRDLLQEVRSAKQSPRKVRPKKRTQSSPVA